jgi:hypothetical protein
VGRDEPPLLNNGPEPTATVAAVAKRALPAGTRFDEALGGFDLRGEAIEIAGPEDVVPITLLDGRAAPPRDRAGARDQPGRCGCSRDACVRILLIEITAPEADGPFRDSGR